MRITHLYRCKQWTNAYHALCNTRSKQTRPRPWPRDGSRDKDVYVVVEMREGDDCGSEDAERRRMSNGNYLALGGCDKPKCVA